MSIIPHDSDLDLFGHLLEYAQSEEYQREVENTPPYKHHTPESQREASATYRKRHPEAIKLRGKARKFGPQLHEKQRGLCYWCGEALEGKYEVDHIQPITHGGTNALMNLCVAHMICNRKKLSRPLQQMPLF